MGNLEVELYSTVFLGNNFPLQKLSNSSRTTIVIPYPIELAKKLKKERLHQHKPLSLMQAPSSGQGLASHSTKQPHTAYKPNSHDSALFDIIIEALTRHKRPISELEGLKSHQVVDKLQSMGIMDSQDMLMIGYNKKHNRLRQDSGLCKVKIPVRLIVTNAITLIPYRDG